MFDAITANTIEPWNKNHMGLLDSIIGAESGGNPNAKNENSSASGLGQFLDGTWLDTIRSARPDLAQGKSDAELIALKTDPQLSRQMTEAYAAQNGEILSKAGHPVTPGNTYLAHFAGPQGAVSVLNADPSAPVSSVLTAGAVKANPFLQGMTAGDLRAWADRKMGGSQPTPASPAGRANEVQVADGSQYPNGARTVDIGGYTMPQMGVPSDYAQRPQRPTPLNPIPRQAPPIFAPQPQSAQPAQEPPMQGPPIFFAPRRSPDLRNLKAAFSQPIFSRTA